MKRTLVFTDQELNTILYGLQKLPYEAVNELINNIVKQLQVPKEEPIKE